VKTLRNPDFWIPLAAVALGWLAAALFRLLTLRHARRRQSRLAALFSRHLTRPLVLLLPVLLGRAVQPLLHLHPEVDPAVRHAATLLLIFGFGWLLIALISVLDESVRAGALSQARSTRDVRVLTRLAIFFRILKVVIAVVTVAAMLVTFPDVRALGTSILASAGIAGIVLGIAARPAVESLIAGLQVAFTEPFHLGDVVVLEGEQGRVEEITSTYVVLGLWDRRRLIVPLAYILQRPFQNLTRAGTSLLAPVTVDVDYSTPVAEVREEAGRIVASSKLWDGDAWNLQVTDAGDRTLRLRVVASAADAASAWDLRCEIRERLVAYLQERHPNALPRVRAAIEGGAPGAG
jgi:small-conductance mechanosensitive channel